jgi:hypothetical protein
MKIYKYILPVMLGAGLVSCEDKLLEINQDPNATVVTTPAATFVSGVAWYGHAVDAYYNELDGLFAQYYAGGPGVALIDDERYFVQNTDYNAEWAANTNQALSDLNYTRKTGNEAQSSIADILSVHVWQNLVDHYGDIPYSEALRGAEGILNPAYDDAESIYDSLVIRIDESIAILESTEDELGDEDILFEGDLDKWIRFAYSEKLRLLMRQSIVNPTKVSADVIELISTGRFIESEDQIVAIPYSGEEGLNYNPMFARREGGVGQFYIVSETFVSVLDGLADPRALVIFDPAAKTVTTTNPDGELLGVAQGGIEDLGAVKAADFSYPSEVSYGEANDVILMSNWEVYFLRAEAAMRFGTADDETAMYNAAITAHFNYIGAEGAGAYLTSDAVLYDASASDQAKSDLIGVQKWISMAGLQEFEGYIESRRFDTPETRIFTDATDGILQRPARSVFGAGEFPGLRLYPQTETSFNPNEINTARTTILEKAFWDN